MQRGVGGTVFCPKDRIYNVGMAWKMMRVAECDVCHHRWIPEVENPPLCPRKSCRSTLWNKGGVDGRTKEARGESGKKRRHNPRPESRKGD
jgi:hypothetical protein